MTLETTFTTADGEAAVVDCLLLEEASDPYRPNAVQTQELVVRVVTGISGAVAQVLDPQHLTAACRRPPHYPTRAFGPP